jgi:hypothetical protein
MEPGWRHVNNKTSNNNICHKCFAYHHDHGNVTRGETRCSGSNDERDDRKPHGNSDMIVPLSGFVGVQTIEIRCDDSHDVGRSREQKRLDIAVTESGNDLYGY